MIRKSLFQPPWWLRNAHLQTCFAPLVRSKARPVPRNERLELPDGDFVDLSWFGVGVGPVVVVLHGLGGSIDSAYARGIVTHLSGSGFRVVLMHFRGCSGVLNRKLRAYHSGDTEDVRYLFSVLRDRLGDTPLGAVGYSLGGNVLLKYLGEEGEQSPITAAVSVCAPLELSKCAERLDTGLSRFYQWYLLSSLNRGLREKMRSMGAGLHLGLNSQDVRSIRTIYDFDECVTAPLHGFAGAADYYEKSSSRQYLAEIRSPVLVLQARDDPFMLPEILPDECELASSVELEIAAGGGHVGFVTGPLPWRPVYWLDHKVTDYLTGKLKPD